MVKARIVTALVMLVIVAGLMFFANFQVWLVAVSAMVAWAAVEWANLAEFSKRAKAGYAFTLPVLLGAAYAYTYDYIHNDFASLTIAVSIVAVVFWLLIVPMWLYFGWRVKSKPILMLVGVLLFLSTGLAMLLVRHDADQAWLLLGLLAVVWIADSAAFFVGRAFGRHKLAPSISPGKTIEGAVGAWLGVSIYLIVATIGMHWLPIDISLFKLLFLAFTLTYISILGDLFESWLKRCAGVKDSGHALPGHGGILDRIDAILSTLPLQVVLLMWVLP